MKRGKFFAVLMVFMCVIMMLMCSIAQADVSLSSSNTNKLILRIEDNTDVASFNFTLTGLPIINATMIGDLNKQVDFNNIDQTTNKVIVYGLNDYVVSNGDLVEFEFDMPQPYGEYVISITDIAAATGEALAATIEIGGDGVIAIRFQEAQALAVKDYIIEKVDTVSPGLDLNDDGVVDIIDYQTICKNLETA